MFRKLLKYDFKFVARWWWIIAVALLGGSVVGALLLRGSIATMGAEEVSTAGAAIVILFALYMLAFILALVAGSIVTFVLLYWRFYAHFYSDEGYLTFTLPVKRRTLLLAKLTNEMIWQVAQILLILACVLIFFLLAPPANDTYAVIDPTLLRTVVREIGEIFGENGGFLPLFVFEGILFVIGLLAFQTCLVHFCITIGAVVAKRHKLLAGIGIYYGANMVVSGVGQLLFGLLGGLMLFGLEGYLVNAEEHVALWARALLLLLVTFALYTLAVLAYCLTQDKLDHKLNLP